MQVYCRRLCNPKYVLHCTLCGEGRDAGSQATEARAATYVCHPCRRAKRPAPKPKRVPASKRSCEVCEKQYRAKGKDQRTCSRACGVKIHARIQAAKPKPTFCPVVWIDCRVCAIPLCAPRRQLCSDECRREDNRRKSAASFVSQAVVTTTPCADCGEDYTTRTATNCGVCKRCQRRRIKARFGTSDRKRARYYGVQYEPIDRLKVYERDGWRCGLCREPVRRDVAAPHPLSPSLDHVIPISTGGDHLYVNVQCAHFLCNSIKGDRGEPQQLALVG